LRNYSGNPVYKFYILPSYLNRLLPRILRVGGLLPNKSFIPVDVYTCACMHTCPCAYAHMHTHCGRSKL